MARLGSSVFSTYFSSEHVGSCEVVCNIVVPERAFFLTLTHASLDIDLRCPIAERFSLRLMEGQAGVNLTSLTRKVSLIQTWVYLSGLCLGPLLRV